LLTPKADKRVLGQACAGTWKIQIPKRCLRESLTGIIRASIDGRFEVSIFRAVRGFLNWASAGVKVENSSSFFIHSHSSSMAKCTNLGGSGGGETQNQLEAAQTDIAPMLTNLSICGFRPLNK